MANGHTQSTVGKTFDCISSDEEWWIEKACPNKEKGWAALAEAVTPNLPFFRSSRDAFRTKNGIKWEKFPSGQVFNRSIFGFHQNVNILWQSDVGIGEPPLCDTRFRYFSKKKTYLSVQIDQISLSHFCKTCFSA